MPKWKLRNRQKTKEEPYNEEKKTKELIQESEENQLGAERRNHPKEVPIKEYSETLYSEGFAQKQPMRQPPETKQSAPRTTWENADTIEHYVDSMQWKRKEPTRTSSHSLADMDKKVDYILLKKKSKS